MGGAWRTGGLVVLLLAFIPLMFGHSSRPAEHGVYSASIVTLIVAVGALSVVGRRAGAVEWCLFLTAALSVTWTAVALFTLIGEARGWSIAAIVAFSALALATGVSLIRQAFQSGRTSDLVFGVLFGLVFLVVRWTSVLENLLWSGLILLLAGGGLLVVARLWIRRDRRLVSGSAA